jgi:MFS family permease
MIVASALLSRWFTARIGAVVALPYAAVGAGMLILPPLTQLLLSTYDWRTTHRLLGAGVLLALPLVMLLPLGRMTAGSTAWQALRLRAASDGKGPWTVSTAVRTSGFWGLFTAYLCTSVAAYSVLPHSVAYLVEQGFNPLIAASAFGMTGMLSVIGILAVGWLSDRFGRLSTVTVTYLSTMLGIVLLILVSGWHSLLLVYGFVLFFGLMQGARGPIIVALVAILFPGGGVGAIYGTLSLALGLGAATGSWASGLLYELTGSYVTSFLVAMGGSLAGLATFWLVRGLREEATSQPHPTARHQ